MQSLAAGRLGKAPEADAEQGLAHLDRRLGHPLPRQADIGVEIEHDAVRRFELVDRRSPEVDFQDPHLDHRNQASEVLDHQIGFAAGFLRDLDPADDVRHAGTEMFLVEAFLALPLGAAHQRQGPMRDVRQRPILDRGVVLRQRELGNPLVGIENPIRMGQPHPREIDAAVARRSGLVRRC